VGAGAGAIGGNFRCSNKLPKAGQCRPTAVKKPLCGVGVVTAGSEAKHGSIMAVVTYGADEALATPHKLN